MNRYEENEPEIDGMDHEFVRQYLSDLLPEINLRLLCEQEADADILFPRNKVFWVEEITLLSYRPGGHYHRMIRDSRPVEVSRRLLERIMRWFRKRLMEPQGTAHSLRP
ncbi:MAG: hypothetical protein NC434_13020 [Ruminococcus sp.]|nr:hypothetical protein [Ruminococcus sp.]